MTWFIIAFILFDLFIFCPLLIYGVIYSCWKPLSDAHPARDAEPDAVRRNFQSFRIGVANFGYSVHVAVDEHHLHLIPVRFAQWFSAKPCSIPWQAIQFKKRSRFGKSATVRIGSTDLMGPAWCLEIADTESEL